MKGVMSNPKAKFRVFVTISMQSQKKLSVITSLRPGAIGCLQLSINYQKGNYIESPDRFVNEFTEIYIID